MGGSQDYGFSTTANSIIPVGGERTEDKRKYTLSLLMTPCIGQRSPFGGVFSLLFLKMFTRRDYDWIIYLNC